MALLNKGMKSDTENTLGNEYKMFGFIFFKLYYQLLQPLYHDSYQVYNPGNNHNLVPFPLILNIPWYNPA